MPLIRLPGLDPLLDLALVQSVQFWPADARRRDQYIAVRCAHEALREHASAAVLHLSRVTVATLVDGPGWGQLEAEAKAWTREALLAGCMLLFFYLEDRFADDLKGNLGYRKRAQSGPSLARARFAVAEMAAELGTWKDGAPIHTSERHLIGVWGRCRTVAHLWATYVWNRDIVRFADLSSPSPAKPLQGFLSVAAHFQEYGKARLLPDKNKRPAPLLPASELWEVDIASIAPKEPPLPPRGGEAFAKQGRLAEFMAKYQART